jgi:NAD(P)-dependent dehydrogenase (short-subunit alcohol dehydrogenase family)
MKVLVIGATGLIGSHAARALVSAGHDVLGLARSEGGAARMREWGIEPLRGDLSQSEKLAQATSRTEATVFAPAVGPAEAAAVAELLALLEGSAKAFVFCSGTGVLSQRTLGEWSPTTVSDFDDFEPLPQLVDRVAVENLVKAAHHRGIRGIVVRPPAVWTHDQPHMLFTHVVEAVATEGPLVTSGAVSTCTAMSTPRTSGRSSGRRSREERRERPITRSPARSRTGVPSEAVVESVRATCVAGSHRCGHRDRPGNARRSASVADRTWCNSRPSPGVGRQIGRGVWQSRSRGRIDEGTEISMQQSYGTQRNSQPAVDCCRRAPGDQRTQPSTGSTDAHWQYERNEDHGEADCAWAARTSSPIPVLESGTLGQRQLWLGANESHDTGSTNCAESLDRRPEPSLQQLP